MRGLILVLLSVAGALTMTSCGRSGPELFPVSGTVTVNGRPAALVRVQFRHADQTLPGNFKSPVGMTDEAGTFHISTNGDRDGAVPGDYTVTFEWMSSNDLGAWDKLGGKFAKPETSTFKIRVEPKTNSLPTFAITVPDADIVTKPLKGR